MTDCQHEKLCIKMASVYLLCDFWLVVDCLLLVCLRIVLVGIEKNKTICYNNIQGSDMMKKEDKRKERSSLSKNAVIRVKIVDINNLGYGVAKHDGMTVFVSGAVDGDECDVKLIKVNKSYCVGIVDGMITESEHRTAPLCPHSRSCGGCSYQSISYSHELEIKQNYVKNAFVKAGLRDVKINETVSDGMTEGYRNKAQYPIAYDGGKYSIGFYASKSHRVIDASECTLQPGIFSRICERMKEFFSRRSLTVYDEQSGRGLLRHLYLRASMDGSSVMLCLVINAESVGCEGELVSFVREQLPEVSTLLLNVNRADTNVVLGDKYICLFGEGHIRDTMCDVELEIAPAAFYQVNHGMAQRLYRKAAELAGLTGRETVYDLYCGIGSIGLSMHKSAARIVGVDIEPSAIECARRNARVCGIENARFFCADASGTDMLFESAGIHDSLEDSVVIFDPPRKGSSEKLISYVCQKAPLRVVYISCNPDTLARDSVYFRNNGYKNYEVTPFDLFPRTGHVECVTVFEKEEN